VITLSRLYVHPVKSMRGLQLSHAQVTASGLAFDRLFMLTDPQGKFITARKDSQLVQFTPALLPDGLILTSPDGSESVCIKFSDFNPQPLETEVWGSHFTALTAPKNINQWLSGYLKREVEMRWVGPELTRHVKNQPQVPLSFADGFPYLLINEASLHDLKQRCPASVKLEQFRPNLVVTGAEAYAEDTWKTIRIGSVIFDLVKPCSRCVLITISTERGRKHPAGEPLKTLQGYRTSETGSIDFGQNMIARNEGIIRAGDSVEVLATHPARVYRAGDVLEKVSLSQTAAQEVAITYQGTAFKGNNQQVLLEQLEQQGFIIPYSCRAGICGSCKLNVIEGEVTALTSSAIGKQGKILSCSCVPVTDLILE